MFSSIWQYLCDHLDVIDLIIGVVGFYVTWIQIRKTRGAAEASKEATNSALTSMSERFSLVDISTISSTLGEVQTALRGDRFETAVLKIQDVRTQLSRVRRRKGFRGDSRQTKIQSTVVSLSKLQSSIEKKLSNPEMVVDITVANDLISNHIGLLGEWSEDLVFSQRSRHNDSR